MGEEGVQIYVGSTNTDTVMFHRLAQFSYDYADSQYQINFKYAKVNVDSAILIGDSLAVKNSFAVGSLTRTPVGIINLIQKNHGHGTDGLVITSDTDDSRMYQEYNGTRFSFGTTYTTTGIYKDIQITPGGNKNLLLQSSGTGLVGIGTLVPFHSLSDYRATPNFGLTSTSTNTNTSTLAQVIDTSSIYFDFTTNKTPYFNFLNRKGETTFSFDSLDFAVGAQATNAQLILGKNVPLRAKLLALQNNLGTEYLGVDSVGIINAPNSMGRATIGAGDSVRVAINGLTSATGTAVVSYFRGLTSVATADTIATCNVSAAGQLTIFGKFGWVVSYFVGKQ